MLKNKFKDFKPEYKMANCDKHGSYKKIILNNLKNLDTGCPICLSEIRLQEKREQEARDNYIKQQRIKHNNKIYLNNSNISNIFLNKKDNITINIEKNIKLFKEGTNKNLFIYGDAGVGKTHFLIRLMLNELSLQPLYINCETFNVVGYKTHDFLESTKKHKVIFFDEAQCFAKNETLELVFLDAYHNGVKFYFASNVNFTQFVDKIKPRIIDRLREHGIDIINFVGQSLRGLKW